MSDAETEAAAAAAAAAAARDFTIQLWTLYSVGVSVVILRTYARVKAVGLTNLRLDDVFMWIAIIFYSAQTTLGYSIGSVAHGFANNGMTDAERAALSPGNPEYEMRVVGSKIQMAGWSIYSSLMCFLKLSMLFFYVRLTDGLGRPYRIKIRIGFALVIASSVASIAAVLFSCLPIRKNWQIYPDPGNSCHPAISRPVVWTAFAANVSTDLYLIWIPIPMLWESSLKLANKIASSIVLGAGIFVLACAICKTVFIATDPEHGAEAAGQWGTREAFVAVFTTNLPMIFPLFKSWLGPLLGSTTVRSSQKSYTLHTIGGGRMGGSSGSNPRSDRRSSKKSVSRSMFDFKLSTLGSQERMVHETPLQSVKVSGEPCTDSHGPPVVHVSRHVDVVYDDAVSPSTGDRMRAGQAALFS